ncbi:MAG: TlpA disulfide reductase family protein [Pseudomonadales bacterium]|jgi:peroxiredoxin|nr:TlpA disulfide reductase family protein [Pseudomonadales bacterium]
MTRPIRSFLALVLMIAATAVQAEPKVGAPAPNFTLPSQDGSPVSLADLRGEVVLLNFWATWCPPCRQEMPLLDQLHSRYSPLGFTLLGVNVEQESELAKQFLANEVPVSFPVLFDPEESVSELYGVPAMPTSVLIDRKGNVRYIHHGYRPGDEEAMQNAVRSIMRERT